MADSEVAVFHDFRRASHQKSHFNYLLLDPRVLFTTACIAATLEQFRSFVTSVFYIGKGKNARSTQHLKEAKVKTSKVWKLFHQCI